MRGDERRSCRQVETQTLVTTHSGRSYALMPRSTHQKPMKNLTHEIPTGKQSILLVKDIAPSGTNRTITDEQLQLPQAP